MPVNILTKLPDGTYRYQGIVSRHFYYVAHKLMFIIFLECFSRPLNISIFYFYSLVVVVPSDEEVMKYGRTQASFNQVVNGVTTTNENDDIRFYNYVINNFINDLIIRWQT